MAFSTGAAVLLAEVARLLPMPSLIVRDSKDGAVLTVHVQPKAAYSACVGIHGEALKIRIAATPVAALGHRFFTRASW